jgi:hypothetical protein
VFGLKNPSFSIVQNEKRAVGNQNKNRCIDAGHLVLHGNLCFHGNGGRMKKSRDLSRLLDPRSGAVKGATDTEGRPGRIPPESGRRWTRSWFCTHEELQCISLKDSTLSCPLSSAS